MPDLRPPERPGSEALRRVRCGDKARAASQHGHVGVSAAAGLGYSSESVVPRGAAVAGTAYLALQEIAEQEPKGQMPPAADLAGTHANVPPATIETPSQLTAAPAADDTVTQRTANSESVETPPSAEVGIVEPPQATPLPEK